MPHEKIKNVQELKQELLRISELDENRNTRLMALALVFLLSELCPTDRTTKHVVKRAWENQDAET
jgi:hypothetical protein